MESKFQGLRCDYQGERERETGKQTEGRTRRVRERGGRQGRAGKRNLSKKIGRAILLKVYKTLSPSNIALGPP